MDKLKKAILTNGKALDGDVLIVDSFLNHQVDCGLMADIGAEFAKLFSKSGITRVATVESSGIAPAAMTALALKVPLLIMKKSASVILQEGTLQTEVFSFTKNAPYQLTLKSKYILPGDRVLLIDDFLAKGEAAFGAARLIEKAGGTVTGIGVVICKAFQPGKRRLTEAGYDVKALANIAFMAENQIEFED